MIDVLRDWYRRYFSDPQAVVLALLLVLGLTVVVTMGYTLAPLIASLILAYLLDDAVRLLELRRVPRIAGVWLVFLLFVTLLVATFFWLLPLLSTQASQFLSEAPNMVSQGRELLLQLPQRYPEIISPDQVNSIMDRLREEIGGYGQTLLSFSLASIPGLVTLVVYLILVPLLIFFFLKDKRHLQLAFVSLLPQQRRLASEVWAQMDVQIGNYVRGKFWEIVIVGGVSFVVFLYLGLNYAPLLAVLVGLSVVVPYVGATVVTFPVALVGFFQWGWSEQFGWLVLAYGVIQALDGNVLVPLLFSEAVNLHPVAIITAVLFFGGLWGFWGVFFSIPLATLVKVLIVNWPRLALDDSR